MEGKDDAREDDSRITVECRSLPYCALCNRTHGCVRISTRLDFKGGTTDGGMALSELELDGLGGVTMSVNEPAVRSTLGLA